MPPDPDRSDRRLGPAAAVVASVISAVLTGLAFPPWNRQALAWVSLAPLLLAIRGGGAWRAAGLAVLWTVVGAYVVGDWMPRAVAVYFLQPRPVGYLVFAFVVASMAAPYYAAFAAAYVRLERRFAGPALPLLAAAAWAGVELGRGRLFTGTPFFIGNPWGLLGYSQVGIDPMVQVAAVTGVYGIGFALLAANAGWVELLRMPGPRTPRRLAKLALAGLGPGAAVLVLGVVVLWGADAGSGKPEPVGVVQADVGLGRRWRPELYGENLAVYLDLTRRVIDQARPHTVFWPESALTFFLEDEPGYQAAIRRVTQPADVELVIGGPRQEGEDPVRYLNSVFLLEPDGRPSWRYDKQYLVPFAEYVPFAGIDLVRRRFAGLRQFQAGADTPPLPTRAGLAGVLVCNEAMLPEVAARRVAAGAEYLLNPSNDTWIPEPKFTEHLFRVIQLRAVEQHRWLVRASTSGPSAIVDPYGRVVARTPSGEPAFLAGSIHPRSDRTPYGRVGDLFAMSCVFVCTCALIVTLRRTPG